MELHVNIAGSCMLVLSYGSLCQYSWRILVCRFLFLCCTVFVCFWFRLILAIVAAAAKSLQLCPTLCNPIDSSTPGSPVPGTLQARTLEWVAISFSNAWKWKVKGKSLSRVQLLVTPWTTAHQVPPSMGFFLARVLEWGAIAFSSNRIFTQCQGIMPQLTC